MKKELYLKWISALISGKYVQTKEGYRVFYENKYRYCAIGVLLDLIDSTRWQKVIRNCYEWPVFNPKVNTVLSTQGFVIEYITDYTVCGESELPSELYRKIIKMNDSGDTFKQIAKEIFKYVNREAIQ